MKSIGIGIIGCGGRIRGVAKGVLKQSEAIQVVALCDPREASISATRDYLETDAPAVSLDELVSNPEIDWVMIGSWNSFHREHAVAALAAGKHVFCEKPLATTVEDCLAIRDAWKKSGKQLSIGFTLRYSPHYRKIKELIDDGRIGDIISMEFNETLDFCHGGYIHGDWRRLQKYAGTHLLEKCCHDVDLVNWMVGSRASRVASFGGLNIFRPENKHFQERVGNDPKSGKPAYQTWPGTVNENPFTGDKDIIDNQVAIIEFENGVRSTFHTNCASGIPERRMYICGTEGCIRADVVVGKIELKRVGFETPLEDVSTEGKGGHGGGDDILSPSIAKSMLEGVPPFTGTEDGLKSAFTCFAIDEAMETGQVVDVAKYWQQVDWDM